MKVEFQIELSNPEAVEPLRAALDGFPFKDKFAYELHGAIDNLRQLFVTELGDLCQEFNTSVAVHSINSGWPPVVFGPSEAFDPPSESDYIEFPTDDDEDLSDEELCLKWDEEGEGAK